MNTRGSTEASAPSQILLEQGFAGASEVFLDELLRPGWTAKSADQKLLGALGDRWYDDRRPAMRALLVRYIDDGCDRAFHRVLVKRLFYRAERARDDELMGHFLVAFDRLLSRRLVSRTRWRYDAASRTSHSFTVHRLRCASHFTADKGRRLYPPHFTRLTRAYLARRALRYFRRLGHRDPSRFVSTVARVLARYEDQHLERPEQLLDAWGLLGLLYHAHPAVSRADRRGARLAPGHTLAELSPSPMHPALWASQTEVLLDLLLGARSNTVRSWAAALLKRDHADALRALTFARLRALLVSAHAPAQQLAAAFLADSEALAALSVDAWFELLRVGDAEVLGVVCALFARHVLPTRVSLARCVELACARPAPLAELGWSWLLARTVVKSPDDVAALLPLCEAGNISVRAQASPWLAARIEEAGTALQLRTMLDSRHADMRAAALASLRAGRFRDEPLLWSALTESPYGDARDELVAHLRERLPLLSHDAVRFVWASTLLSVHRGSRARRMVLSQLSSQLAAHPDEGPALLPLLRVALRSVRQAERRAALASIARAAFAQPSLRGAIEAAMPELELFAAEPASVPRVLEAQSGGVS